MAVRTTAPQVKELIETDPSIKLTPFIATANSLVDWLHSVDSDGLLNDLTLELIERWLAAHFYEKRDQGYQQKATGRANAQFQGQTGFVFMSTYWGQTACGLDVTGRLGQRSKDAEQGITRNARVRWLGTEPENLSSSQDDAR